MWNELYIYAVNAALTAGNGTVLQQFPIRIDSDADFEIQKLVYWATNGSIRARFIEEALSRYLPKFSADLRTIAGNFIGTPYILPKARRIPAGTTYTLEAADASGVANTLRLAIHGAKIRSGNPPWGTYNPETRRVIWNRFRAMDFAIIQPDNQPIALAANATAAVTINVDNDAHFLVQRAVGSRTGNCLVTIKEVARGRDWMNTPIHFDCMFGNGQFQNEMKDPRFIYRGSVISIDIQNLEAFAIQVNMTFSGVKLFE